MIEGLVSVIMPVYQEVNFLRHAIESIFGQTYREIELIIVDSTPDEKPVKSIIAEYGQKIRYFHIEKKGVAIQLNYGILHTNGEFIARMDADDISLPERFAAQIDFLNTNQNIDLVGTQYQLIDEDGNILTEKSQIPCGNDEITAETIFTCSMAHPSVMFRRSLLEQGWRYAESSAAEDYDLWTRMACKAKFSNLPDILLHYRVHKNNVTKVLRGKLLESSAQSSMLCIERLFGIDSNDYLLLDFYDPNSISESQKNIEFYNRQISLLIEIYKRNHSINREALIKALNTRWNKVVRKIDIDFNHQLTLPQSKLSVFFFSEYLSIFFTCSENEIQQKLSETICNNINTLKKLSKLNKKFVIYGLGKAGKGLLNRYNAEKDAGSTKWELVGVIDKKNESCISGKSMLHAQKKEVLKSMCFDYVIISSDIYYTEIRQELLEIGVERNKIERRDFLMEVLAQGIDS